jgi:hypothetical protein
VFKLLRDFATEEILSYELFNARKEEKLSTMSYLQEEDKIRHWVFFVLQVSQFKKAEDFLYDKLPTRAMEVRESQGSRWVCQGWSNPTEENVGKLEREKKETKEGWKVAPVKATFRVSQTKNSFFFVHEYWGSEKPILIEVSAPAFFLKGSHVWKKFWKQTT